MCQIDSGGVDIVVSGISDDGKIVVGATDEDDGNYVFYWTEDTGLLIFNKIFEIGANTAISVGTQNINGEFYIFSNPTGLSAIDSFAIRVNGSSYKPIKMPLNKTFKSNRYSNRTDLFAFENASGYLVGQLDFKATVWADGNIVKLPDFCDPLLSCNSQAYDISQIGPLVVGEAEIAKGQTRAFLWRFPNETTILGCGTDRPECKSSARAISENGEVVIGVTGAKAFSWTQAYGFYILPTKPLTELENINGGFHSQAYAVDSDGYFIGGYSGPNAVIWSKNESPLNFGRHYNIYNIGSLSNGRYITRVTALSSYGSTAAAGWGMTDAGMRGFLWIRR